MASSPPILQVHAYLSVPDVPRSGPICFPPLHSGFPKKPAISFFKGRESELELLKESAAITVLSGLTGVGTSAIALQHMWTHEPPYDHCLYFDAQNIDKLKEQYGKLARSEDFKLSDATALGTDESLVEPVKTKLKSLSNAFILYDNATTENELHPFLPTGDEIKSNNIKIVITSRQNAWRSYNLIPVGPMIHDDAKVLAGSFFPKGARALSEHDLGRLVTSCDHLPVAVLQLAHYRSSTGTDEAPRASVIFDKDMPDGYKGTKTWKKITDVLWRQTPFGREILRYLARNERSFNRESLSEEMGATIVKDLTKVADFNNAWAKLTEYYLIKTSDTSDSSEIIVPNLVKRIILEYTEELAIADSDAAKAAASAVMPSIEESSASSDRISLTTLNIKERLMGIGRSSTGIKAEEVVYEGNTLFSIGSAPHDSLIAMGEVAGHLGSTLNSLSPTFTGTSTEAKKITVRGHTALKVGTITPTPTSASSKAAPSGRLASTSMSTAETPAPVAAEVSRPAAAAAAAEKPVKSPILSKKTVRVDEYDINCAYQYEDTDITAILNARVRQYDGRISDSVIHAMAPVDTTTENQLKKRLETDRDMNHGKRINLIPCNIGDYHWVGLLLQFDATNECVRAEFINSINGAIPEELTRQLGDVYPHVTFRERFDLIKQDDDYSCGACTIENLILSMTGDKPEKMTMDKIRAQHLQCLKTDKEKDDILPAERLARSRFFADFEKRQRLNEPTFDPIARDRIRKDSSAKVFSSVSAGAVATVKSEEIDFDKAKESIRTLYNEFLVSIQAKHTWKDDSASRTLEKAEYALKFFLDTDTTRNQELIKHHLITLLSTMTSDHGAFSKRIGLTQAPRIDMIFHEIKTTIKTLIPSKPYDYKAFTIDLTKHLPEGEDLKRFETFLKELNSKIRKENIFPPGTVFFAYAWLLEENKSSEHWVQEFLLKLRHYFDLAGLNPLLDIRDSHVGVSKFHAEGLDPLTSFVLLLGTPSLRQKHDRAKGNVICEEINKIRQKFEDHKENVKLVNLFPRIKDYRYIFPDSFEYYTDIHTWKVEDFYENMKELIRTIYKISIDNEVYKQAWNDFTSRMTPASAATSAASSATPLFNTAMRSDERKEEEPAPARGGCGAPLDDALPRR